MKKFISGLLILCLIMFSFSIPIYSTAASSANISVDNVSGNRGDTVSVSVKISRNSNIQALGFNLNYDKDVLELVSATKGEVTATTQTIVNTRTLGKVVFSCVSSSSPITVAGSLVDIEFKIKATATYGNSTVKVNVTEASDGDFNSVNMIVQDGYVAVDAPQLPAPERLLVEEVFFNAITLSWDYVDEASGYNVYVNGNKANEEMITAPGYTVTELDALTSYEIQVTAINHTVESERSEKITISTIARQFVVGFYDESGTLIEEFYVDEGEGITAPMAPVKEGYTFEAWRINSFDSTRGTIVDDFSKIADNMSLRASYVKQTLEVTFVDWDGTLICAQEIAYGEAATAPEEPNRQGYSFAGWDKAFDNVKEDMVITALYTEMECAHTNTEIQNARESTCKEHGYGGEVVCLDCGNTVAVGAELELADHKYNSVITAPTPEAQGYTTHTCSVCGDSYVDSYTEYVDENAPQIIVSSKKSLAGKTVDVTVALKNNPGIASAKLQLDFDSSVLTLVDVTDAGKLGIQCHKPEYTSPYVLSWMNDTATTDFDYDGTIATLRFEVSDGAELGDYNIDLSYDYDNYDIWNVAVEKVKFAVIDGKITVINTIIGDVNSDGAVNTLDRMTLARYLANWEGYTAETIDMVAADVNGDGIVNTLDRMVLARHLANWEGYQELPYEE